MSHSRVVSRASRVGAPSGRPGLARGWAPAGFGSPAPGLCDARPHHFLVLSCSRDKGRLQFPERVRVQPGVVPVQRKACRPAGLWPPGVSNPSIRRPLSRGALCSWRPLDSGRSGHCPPIRSRQGKGLSLSPSARRPFRSLLQTPAALLQVSCRFSHLRNGFRLALSSF
uniref:Uncharacterized protein n=1 Tax=Pipistrellus kuhlii TaxID=59472 RepID=A0A7J7XUU5_PIPKU|nr:hypothetical protein mPipKuh1_010427 [Pipistrellus kuhlii]